MSVMKSDEELSNFNRGYSCGYLEALNFVKEKIEAELSCKDGDIVDSVKVIIEDLKNKFE